MAKAQGRHGQLALELDCRDRVKSASFTPGPGGEGGLFSCSIGPVTEETIATLDQAAQTHTLVSLSFSDQPVLLDLVTLERKEPLSIRIVGQLVRATTQRSA
jgi:hypothetical protein